MPDTYLRGLLAARGDLASHADALIERCRAEQRPGERLVSVLARLAVFQPTAARTLDLMRKGFLSPDLALLLAPNGAERLAALLNETVHDGCDSTPPPQAKTHRFEAVAMVRTPRGETVPEMKIDNRTTGEPRNAPPPTVSVAPAVGSVLGRCLITAVLGRGGHGVVYAALHQSLNIPVAVKVLVSGNGPDPHVQAKLRHEARALARLNHPNVIRVLDFDDGDPPYAVMEYVEGPSLADLITQTGGIRVDRARDIFIQVCRGLDAAWGEGIVHRDIKPGNILLTRNGVAKLADLGLALTSSAADDHPTRGGPVGTCAYMAPEQARSANDVDFSADIYALGTTFYHAVTGRHPFPARNAREALFKHASEPVVPPHELAPHLIDPATSAVVVRMMAKTPEGRHHSYAELIDDLTSCGPNEPPGSTPKTATNAQPATHAPRASGIRGWFRAKKEV